MEHTQQTQLVDTFCEFLSEQVKDLRMRSERSHIRQGVGVQGKSLDETILYSIIYFFLSNYFKWESNFCRTVLRQVGVDSKQL